MIVNILLVYQAVRHLKYIKPRQLKFHCKRIYVTYTIIARPKTFHRKTSPNVCNEISDNIHFPLSMVENLDEWKF